LNELGFTIGGRSFDPPHPAFDLQLQVGRAGTVSAEAEFESMVQMLQAETIRTPLVGSIQKGALCEGGGFGHNMAVSEKREANRGDSSALYGASRESAEVMGRDSNWKS
jgi:hypothetical protein